MDLITAAHIFPPASSTPPRDYEIVQRLQLMVCMLRMARIISAVDHG